MGQLGHPGSAGTAESNAHPHPRAAQNLWGSRGPPGTAGTPRGCGDLQWAVGTITGSTSTDLPRTQAITVTPWGRWAPTGVGQGGGGSGWGSLPTILGGCSPEELQVIPAIAHQPLLVPLQPQRPQPLAHTRHGAHTTAQRLHPNSLSTMGHTKGSPS